VAGPVANCVGWLISTITLSGAHLIGTPKPGDCSGVRSPSGAATSTVSTATEITTRFPFPALLRPRTPHLTRIFTTRLYQRIPKGFRHKAQGCEQRATLGKITRTYQLRRSCANHSQGICRAPWTAPSHRSGATSSRLMESGETFPRVARCSQPWAGGHNPFGIETACKVQRGQPHSTTLSRVMRRNLPPGFEGDLNASKLIGVTVLMACDFFPQSPLTDLKPSPILDFVPRRMLFTTIFCTGRVICPFRRQM
jgi:hypothetical protein